MLFLLGACQKQDHTVARTGGTDSSTSVSVPFTTSRAELESAPRIELQEEVRIASTDGPDSDQFATVTHTTFGTDDRIYTLDASDHLVRVFDKDGKKLLQFGKAGAGPGELKSPRLVAASNDTIIVLDPYKVQMYRRDGTFMSSVPHKTSHPRGYMDVPLVQHTKSGWTFAIRHASYAARPEDNTGKPTRDSIKIQIVNPATGEQSAPIAVILGPPVWLLGRAGWIREPYMAAAPRYAMGLDGMVYTSPGDQYLIDVYAPDGTLARSVHADVAKIPVTAADFQRSLDAEIQETAKFAASGDGAVAEGEESEGAALLRMLKNEGTKPGHATHRPIVGRIIASTSGALLVERLDLDPRPDSIGDPSTWDHIDEKGRVTGRFVAEPKVFPRLLDGENVFAVVRDANDVPMIVRYRMRRE